METQSNPDVVCEAELWELRAAFGTATTPIPLTAILQLVRLLARAGVEDQALVMITRSAANAFWDQGRIADALLAAQAVEQRHDQHAPRARWLRVPLVRSDAGNVLTSYSQDGSEASTLDPPSIVPRIDLLHLDRVVRCSIGVASDRMIVRCAPRPGCGSIAVGSFERATYAIERAGCAERLPCICAVVAAGDDGSVTIELLPAGDQAADVMQRDIVVAPGGLRSSVTAMLVTLPHARLTRWLPNTCAIPM